MLGDAVLFLTPHLIIAWLCARMARDRRLLRLLIPYAVIVSLFGALVVGDSQPLFPGGSPNLFGSDGEGYFRDARAIVEGRSLGVLDGYNYIGFQIFLAGLFFITGPEISVALMANTLFLPLTATAVYLAAYEASDNRGAGLAATAFFMLTPAHAYYALTLLKDPAITLAFALTVLAFVRVVRGQKVDWRVLAILGLSIGIIGVMRASLFPVVALLIGMGVLLSKQRLLLLPALVPMFAYIALSTGRLSGIDFSLGYFTQTIGANEVVSDTLASGNVATSGVVGTLAGIYTGLPFVLKLLGFPLLVAMQFYLPIDFWSTAFLTEHVVAFLSRNLGPLWYLFTGVWMLFAVWKFFSIHNLVLRWLLGAGLVMYILIAVVYVGAIPRYSAPFLTLMYPAMGYWLHRAGTDGAVRWEAARFFALYFIAAWLGASLYLTFYVIR